MRKKMLSTTDLAVSAIGLGTVKFGRNQGVKYPEQFALPSDFAIEELLDCAQALGINLLDTAPAYGTSEERLGKILKNQRHRWVLSTKVGEEFMDGNSYFDFSPQHIQASVERSLKRLCTDYLDIVLVHSNGNDVEIIEQSAVFETLATLKKRGLIRAVGMSTKTIAGGMLAVDYSDVVMVTYNPLYIAEQPVIAYAQQKNKTVFIKKGLASGHLEKVAGTDPVKTALDFIFAEPGVSSVIIGTLNKEHLIHNAQCLPATTSSSSEMRRSRSE